MVRLMGLSIRETNSSHTSLSHESAQRQTTFFSDKHEYRGVRLLGASSTLPYFVVPLLISLTRHNEISREFTFVDALTRNGLPTQRVTISPLAHILGLLRTRVNEAPGSWQRAAASLTTWSYRKLDPVENTSFATIHAIIATPR